MSFFPTHYLYDWLACYFTRHYVLHPALAFDGALFWLWTGKKFWGCSKAYPLGAIAYLGHTMLSKNKYETLNDDGTLGYEKLSYLIALHSGYLPLHHATTFYVMPYSPYPFSRQFGFWQELLGALKLDPYTRTTSYNDALYFWTAILSKNTKSITMLLSRLLHLNKLITKKYQDLWSEVAISDLRANVCLLQHNAWHDASKSKKNTMGNTSKEGSNFEDQDSDVEQTNKSLIPLLLIEGGHCRKWWQWPGFRS